MSDERCGAMHPRLGIRCVRRAKHCWGIDHLGIRDGGYLEFWPDPHGTTPVSRFFEAWVKALQTVTEESEKQIMESNKESAQQPTSKPPCSICSMALDLQSTDPWSWWCGVP